MIEPDFTLARVAFSGWFLAEYPNGRPSDAWADLREDERARWEAAAQAVADRVSRPTLSAAPILVLLLLLLALCGCASGPYTHGIQNLACVDSQANIWRGGQPDAQGWAFLSASGVSNVVKLNTGAELAPAGWCVTRCPITTWQQVFGPVGRQASNAMRAITPGTFIHCEHGVNRTGAAVMLYRVEHGWTKAAAQAEADAMGWESSFPALKAWWRNIPE